MRRTTSRSRSATTPSAGCGRSWPSTPTALGPALGGTRFYPYDPTRTAALADVLDLSKAMAYKNALAGLDHGGGKAVIIGDPATDKSEPLLRAYGRFLEGLGGRYITACDVGTYVADMDVVADGVALGHRPQRRARRGRRLQRAHRVRRVPGHARRGPPLLGRRHAGRAAGRDRRRRQGRQAPRRPRRRRRCRPRRHRRRPGRPRLGAPAPPRRRRSSTTRRRSCGEDIDVYAPCALGHAIDDDVAEALRATIVCGGANNQLAHDRIDNRLAERGIVFCPDYLVNAGGVIQVADELHGFSFERAKAKAAGIYDATLDVLRLARAEGVTPVEAADRLAEQRMAAVGPATGSGWRRAERAERAQRSASDRHTAGSMRAPWRSALARKSASRSTALGRSRQSSSGTTTRVSR